MEKIFSFPAKAKKIAHGLNHSTFIQLFSLLFRAILLVFTPCDNSPTSSLKVKNHGPEIVNNEQALLEEAVLDTLASFCNQIIIGDKVGLLAEVLASFNETEPCLEEVKQAFDMFDENGDGYIDANELNKIISRMGFLEFSVEDCQRMIVPFDDNKDGKIEFGEFLKLMEESAFL